MALSKTTQDHDEIRRWAETRGAQPAEVAATHSDGQPGILRFCFPNSPNRKDKNLREISWDDFFEKFDENNLELIYQEKTSGGQRSNFNKLVHPADKSSAGQKTKSTSAAAHPAKAGSHGRPPSHSGGSGSRSRASGGKSGSSRSRSQHAHAA